MRTLTTVLVSLQFAVLFGHHISKEMLLGGRGVGYLTPTRQWHVEMAQAYSATVFTGPAGMFVFRQSATMQARLHTQKSDTSHSYHLLLSSFVRLA